MKQIKILLLAALLLGCKKEEPIETPPPQCNCGIMAIKSNSALTKVYGWMHILGSIFV
jgi:hypothetical protein